MLLLVCYLHPSRPPMEKNVDRIILEKAGFVVFFTGFSLSSKGLHSEKKKVKTREK